MSIARSTRRRFIKTALGTAAIASLPPLVLAQQNAYRVATIAGTGVAGYEPEGSRGANAANAPINNPYGVVIGPDRALYFCEVDTGRTRRLNLETNRIRTYAGNGVSVFTGEAILANQTSFAAPHEIRFDEMGNLYIVERDGHAVRRVAARTGFVSLVAGSGVAGFEGDGRSSIMAKLRQPHSIAFDADGNLLICDIGDQRLRSVSRETGVISTLSGTGERLPTPDSAELTGTPLLGPRSIDTDTEGNAYLVLREGNAVFKLDIRGNRLERIAGTGEKGYSGDGGAALDATFNGPKGIAYSRRDNSLYIVDTENHVIRKMSLASGMIETVLGNGERGDGPDGNPMTCKLNRPHGVFVDSDIVYVTDSENHRIRAITRIRV
jgi:DNA-binding beta-propeller fold protein YncE